MVKAQSTVGTVGAASGTVGTIGTAASSVATGSAASATSASVVLPPRKKEYFKQQSQFVLLFLAFQLNPRQCFLVPKLIARFGGIAFLIIFLILTMSVSLPIIFVELVIGQFRGEACLVAFTCVPAAKGIGTAMLLISLVIATYHSVYACYCVRFFLSTFDAQLPWTYCNPQWSETYGQLCAKTNYTIEAICNDETLTIMNNYNDSSDILTNATEKDPMFYRTIRLCGKVKVVLTDVLYSNTSEVCYNHLVTPAKFFSRRVVFRQARHGIHESGSLDSIVLSCAIAGWVIVFLLCHRGFESYSKSCIVICACILGGILVLNIRLALMAGAISGLFEMLKPNLEETIDLFAWLRGYLATMLAFQSGSGVYISLGAYNKFTTNVLTNFTFSCFVPSIAMVYVLFIVFTGQILGIWSHIYGLNCLEYSILDIPQFLSEIVPEVLSLGLFSTMFSMIFFFVLILMQAAYVSVHVCNILECFWDLFPRARNRMILTTAALCTVLFLSSIPLYLENGLYVLSLLQDHSVINVTTVFVPATLIFAIVFIYGSRRFAFDVNFMTEKAPDKKMMFCWKIFIPTTITIVYLYGFIKYKQAAFQETVFDYPTSYEALAWLIGLIIILQVPVAAIVIIIQNIQMPAIAFKPEFHWEPNDEVKVNGYFDELEEEDIEGESQPLPDLLHDDTEQLRLSLHYSDVRPFFPKMV